MFANLSLILLLFGSKYRLPPSPPHIHPGRQCPRVIPYDTELRQVAKSGTWYINRVTATSSRLRPYTCMKAEFNKDPHNKKGLTIEFQGLMKPDTIETSIVRVAPAESGNEGIFEIDPNARYIDLKATSIISHKIIGEHEYIVLYACFYLPESHRYCDGAMILSRQPRLYLADLEELNKDLNRRQEKPIFMRHIFHNVECEKLDEYIKEIHLKAGNADTVIETQAPKHMKPVISEDSEPMIREVADNHETTGGKEPEIRNGDERHHDSNEQKQDESITKASNEGLKKYYESLNQEENHNNTELITALNARSLPQHQPVKCPYLLSQTTPKPAPTDTAIQQRKLEITKPVQAPAIAVKKPLQPKLSMTPSITVDKAPVLSAKKRKQLTKEFKDVGIPNYREKNYPRKTIPESAARAWRIIKPTTQNVKYGSRVDNVLLTNAKKRRTDPPAFRKSGNFKGNQGSPNFNIKDNDKNRKEKILSNKHKDTFFKAQRSQNTGDQDYTEKPKKFVNTKDLTKPISVKQPANRIVLENKDRGQRAQQKGTKENRHVFETKPTSVKKSAYRIIKAAMHGKEQRPQRRGETFESDANKKKTKSSPNNTKKFPVSSYTRTPAFRIISTPKNRSEPSSPRIPAFRIISTPKNRSGPSSPRTPAFRVISTPKNRSESSSPRTPAFRIISTPKNRSEPSSPISGVRYPSGGEEKGKGSSNAKPMYRFIHNFKMVKNQAKSRARDITATVNTKRSRSPTKLSDNEKPGYQDFKKYRNFNPNTGKKQQKPTVRDDGPSSEMETFPEHNAVKNSRAKNGQRNRVIKKPGFRLLKKPAGQQRHNKKKHRQQPTVEDGEKVDEIKTPSEPSSTKDSRSKNRKRDNDFPKSGIRVFDKNNNEKRPNKKQHKPMAEDNKNADEIETPSKQSTRKKIRAKSNKHYDPYQNPMIRVFNKTSKEGPNKKSRRQEPAVVDDENADNLEIPSETSTSKKPRSKSERRYDLTRKPGITAFSKTKRKEEPNKKRSRQEPEIEDDEKADKAETTSKPIAADKSGSKGRKDHIPFQKTGIRVFNKATSKEVPNKKKNRREPMDEDNRESDDVEIPSEPSTVKKSQSKNTKRYQPFSKPEIKEFNETASEVRPNKNKHRREPMDEDDSTSDEVETSSEQSTTRKSQSKNKKPGFRMFQKSSSEQGPKKKKHKQLLTVESQETSEEMETSPEFSIGNKSPTEKRQKSFEKPGLKSRPTTFQNKQESNNPKPTFENQETLDETGTLLEPSTTNKFGTKKRNNSSKKPSSRKSTYTNNHDSNKNEQNQNPPVESLETSDETDILPADTAANKSPVKKRNQQLKKPGFRMFELSSKKLESNRTKHTPAFRVIQPYPNRTKKPGFRIFEPSSKELESNKTKHTPAFRVIQPYPNRTKKPGFRILEPSSKELESNKTKHTPAFRVIQSYPNRTKKPGFRIFEPSSKELESNKTKHTPAFRVIQAYPNRTKKPGFRIFEPSSKELESNKTKHTPVFRVIQPFPNRTKKPGFRIFEPSSKELKSNKKKHTPAFRVIQRYPNRTTTNAKKQRQILLGKDSSESTENAERTPTPSRSLANSKSRQKPAFRITKNYGKNTKEGTSSGPATRHHNFIRKPVFRMLRNATRKPPPSNKRQIATNTSVIASTSASTGYPVSTKRSENKSSSPRVKKQSKTQTVSEANNLNEMYDPKLDDKMNEIEDRQQPSNPNKHNQPEEETIKKHRHHFTGFAMHPAQLGKNKVRPRTKTTDKISKINPMYENAKRRRINPAAFRHKDIYTPPVTSDKANSTFENAKKRRTTPAAFRHKDIYTPPVTQTKTNSAFENAKKRRTNPAAFRHKDIYTPPVTQTKTNTAFENAKKRRTNPAAFRHKDIYTPPVTQTKTNTAFENAKKRRTNPAAFRHKDIYTPPVTSDKANSTFENAKKRRTTPAAFRHKDIYTPPVTQTKTNTAFENAKKRRTNPAAFRHKDIYTPPVTSDKANSTFENAKKRRTTPAAFRHKDIYTPPVTQTKTNTAFENAKKRRTNPAAFRHKDIYTPPVTQTKEHSTFENAKKRRTNPAAFQHKDIYTPPVTGGKANSTENAMKRRTPPVAQTKTNSAFENAKKRRTNPEAFRHKNIYTPPVTQTNENSAFENAKKRRTNPAAFRHKDIYTPPVTGDKANSTFENAKKRRTPPVTQTKTNSAFENAKKRRTNPAAFRHKDIYTPPVTGDKANSTFENAKKRRTPPVTQTKTNSAFENAKKRRTNPAAFRHKDIYTPPVTGGKANSTFENAKKRRTNPAAFRHKDIYTPPVTGDKANSTFENAKKRRTPPVTQTKTNSAFENAKKRRTNPTAFRHKNIYTPPVTQTNENSTFENAKKRRTNPAAFQHKDTPHATQHKTEPRMFRYSTRSKGINPSGMLPKLAIRQEYIFTPAVVVIEPLPKGSEIFPPNYANYDKQYQAPKGKQTMIRNKPDYKINFSNSLKPLNEPKKPYYFRVTGGLDHRKQPINPKPKEIALPSASHGELSPVPATSDSTQLMKDKKTPLNRRGNHTMNEPFKQFQGRNTFPSKTKQTSKGRLRNPQKRKPERIYISEGTDDRTPTPENMTNHHMSDAPSYPIKKQKSSKRNNQLPLAVEPMQKSQKVKSYYYRIVEGPAKSNTRQATMKRKATTLPDQASAQKRERAIKMTGRTTTPEPEKQSKRKQKLTRSDKVKVQPKTGSKKRSNPKLTPSSNPTVKGTQSKRKSSRQLSKTSPSKKPQRETLEEDDIKERQQSTPGSLSDGTFSKPGRKKKQLKNKKYDARSVIYPSTQQPSRANAKGNSSTRLNVESSEVPSQMGNNSKSKRLQPTSANMPNASNAASPSPSVALKKRRNQAKPGRNAAAKSSSPKFPAVHDYYYKLMAEPNKTNSQNNEQTKTRSSQQNKPTKRQEQTNEQQPDSPSPFQQLGKIDRSLSRPKKKKRLLFGKKEKKEIPRLASNNPNRTTAQETVTNNKRKSKDARGISEKPNSSLKNEISRSPFTKTPTLLEYYSSVLDNKNKTPVLENSKQWQAKDQPNPKGKPPFSLQNEKLKSPLLKTPPRKEYYFRLYDNPNNTKDQENLKSNYHPEQTPKSTLMQAPPRRGYHYTISSEPNKNKPQSKYSGTMNFPYIPTSNQNHYSQWPRNTSTFYPMKQQSPSAKAKLAYFYRLSGLPAFAEKNPATNNQHSQFGQWGRNKPEINMHLPKLPAAKEMHFNKHLALQTSKDRLTSPTGPPLSYKQQTQSGKYGNMISGPSNFFSKQPSRKSYYFKTYGVEKPTPMQMIPFPTPSIPATNQSLTQGLVPRKENPDLNSRQMTLAGPLTPKVLAPPKSMQRYPKSRQMAVTHQKYTEPPKPTKRKQYYFRMTGTAPKHKPHQMIQEPVNTNRPATADHQFNSFNKQRAQPFSTQPKNKYFPQALSSPNMLQQQQPNSGPKGNKRKTIIRQNSIQPDSKSKTIYYKPFDFEALKPLPMKQTAAKGHTIPLPMSKSNFVPNSATNLPKAKQYYFKLFGGPDSKQPKSALGMDTLLQDSPAWDVETSLKGTPTRNTLKQPIDKDKNKFKKHKMRKKLTTSKQKKPTKSHSFKLGQKTEAAKPLPGYSAKTKHEPKKQNILSERLPVLPVYRPKPPPKMYYYRPYTPSRPTSNENRTSKHKFPDIIAGMPDYQQISHLNATKTTAGISDPRNKTNVSTSNTGSLLPAKKKNKEPGGHIIHSDCCSHVTLFPFPLMALPPNTPPSKPFSISNLQPVTPTANPFLRKSINNTPAPMPDEVVANQTAGTTKKPYRYTRYELFQQKRKKAKAQREKKKPASPKRKATKQKKERPLSKASSNKSNDIKKALPSPKQSSKIKQPPKQEYDHAGFRTQPDAKEDKAAGTSSKDNRSKYPPEKTYHVAKTVLPIVRNDGVPSIAKQVKQVLTAFPDIHSTIPRKKVALGKAFYYRVAESPRQKNEIGDLNKPLKPAKDSSFANRPKNSEKQVNKITTTVSPTAKGNLKQQPPRGSYYYNLFTSPRHPSISAQIPARVRKTVSPAAKQKHSFIAKPKRKSYYFTYSGLVPQNNPNSFQSFPPMQPMPPQLPPSSTLPQSPMAPFPLEPQMTDLFNSQMPQTNYYGQPMPQINPYAAQMPQMANPFGAQVPQMANPYSAQMPQMANPYSGQMPQMANPYGAQMPQMPNPYGAQMPQMPNPYGAQIPQMANPFGSQAEQMPNYFGTQTQPNPLQPPGSPIPSPDLANSGSDHSIHQVLKVDEMSPVMSQGQVIAPMNTYSQQGNDNYGPPEDENGAFTDLDVKYGSQPIFSSNDYDYGNKPLKNADNEYENSRPFTKEEAEFPLDESSEKLEGNVLTAEHTLQDQLYPTRITIPVFGKIKMQTRKHHHFGGLHISPQKKTFVGPIGDFPSYVNLRSRNRDQETLVSPEKPKYHIEGKRYRSLETSPMNY